MCITLSKSQDNEIKQFIATYLKDGCRVEDDVLYAVTRSIYPADTNISKVPLEKYLDDLGFNRWSMPNESSKLNSFGTYHTILTIENILGQTIGDLNPADPCILAVAIRNRLKDVGISVRKTIESPRPSSVVDILIDGLTSIKPRHSKEKQIETMVSEFQKQGYELFQPRVEARTPDSVLIERGLKEQPNVEQPNIERPNVERPNVEQPNVESDGQKSDEMAMIKTAVKESFPKGSYPMEAGHDKIVSDIIDNLSARGMLLNPSSKAQLNSHMEDVFRDDVTYETPAQVVGSKFMKRINNDPHAIEFERTNVKEEIEQKNMSFKM